MQDIDIRGVFLSLGDGEKDVICGTSWTVTVITPHA